jgi:DNA-binding NarL/FixJ family response regulator
MIQLNQVQWLKINDFLLSIEKSWGPKEFCMQVMDRIYTLMPYDKARIYIINNNEQISHEILFGVEKRWSEKYLTYYSKIENNRYSIFINRKYQRPEIQGSVTDWSNFKIDEFISSYIEPQGIKHSLGFALDGDAFGRCIFCFDRTSYTRFQDQEIEILSIVHPHIQNLLRNSFVTLLSNSHFDKNPEVKISLTKREHEIAELLFKGVTPSDISNKLCISLTTAYKHIANIHTKLNVSNRQRLILALYGYFQGSTNQNQHKLF